MMYAKRTCGIKRTNSKKKLSYAVVFRVKMNRRTKKPR